MNKPLTHIDRQAVAPVQPRASMGMVLRPQSFSELATFAQMAAKSAMVPRDYQNKPENIMLAVQMGSELGLAPMQSLQNIACVNGRPSVWGDAMPGLCRQSSLCRDIKEWFEGEGDTLTAFCEAHREGSSPVRQSFSVADAKKAGLWGKQGPWTQYPRRMLQMRARTFTLRDAFPDVLRGLISVEEARDIPPDAPRETYAGPTIDGHSEPYHAPQADPAPQQEQPKRQTVSGWLDMIEGLLRAAMDAPDSVDQVQDVLARDDVRKAQATLVNGAQKRLNGMIQAALESINGPEPDPEDDFPSDRTGDA